jgi:hypothetical protein
VLRPLAERPAPTEQTAISIVTDVLYTPCPNHGPFVACTRRIENAVRALSEAGYLSEPPTLDDVPVGPPARSDG